jgi:hypothetical protein
MNAQVEKLRLIEWIIRLNDKSILERILKIKAQSGEEDWFSTISQAEIDSIDRGINDYKVGKVRPHSQVRKKYEKWLKD